MIITKKALPRRTFLRGLGSAVALPLLDAMAPAMTALAASPGACPCGVSASSTCRWARTSSHVDACPARISRELSPSSDVAGAGPRSTARSSTIWS